MPERLIVGICTYRRPELARTLESLRDMLPCGAQVSVAVADNDNEPSAMKLVTGIANGFPLPITYLHAPAGNISIARNALLDHARAQGARFFVYVDDDQTLRPDTLQALMQARADSGAGAVLGVVHGAYSPDAPRWMLSARPHDTHPVLSPDGSCRAGYTGNNLVDLADPAWQGLDFDLSRGRSGGEDTEWFARYLAAGGRIAPAPRAIVDETVPSDRTSLRWLLRRRYRMGQTHAETATLGRGNPARWKLGAVAAAKCAACLTMAVASGTSSRRNPQLMRAGLHAGVVARILGAGPVELYGPAATKKRQA
ncbi:glycosyltransferase family A protein [Falsirhodobacter sp. 20TX0035]|uniref:glycosyltransferase family A protein n=1 Tax=Falsirhodobacter sp. 20TX0035 TaxID=3022019 RepID=UPI00232AF592|nr:glycosyltransferase family A protein [Falsirhodobacter sp. 20TX0035]MDB6454796.1 glycosyltransferase family A protein [Falsirhodobacter sp. 20TX0035]